MNRLLILIAASAFAVPPALAEESPDHARSSEQATPMQGMHEHMKTMEECMSKMHGMKD